MSQQTPDAPAAPPAPHFTGKFDLYSTQLPFLKTKYLPAGASQPDFAAVYREILFYQAKPDFSMRMALRADGAGRFACRRIVEPMGDEELGPVDVVRGAAGAVVFGTDEVAHASMASAAPEAWSAKMRLDGSRCGCFIEGGNGSVKMRRVWTGEGGEELFEGYWTLWVGYGAMMARKGFGRGDTYRGAFWAVRARKDAEGNEIGIEEGNGSAYYAGGLPGAEIQGLEYGLGDEDEDEDEDEFGDHYEIDSDY